MWPNIKKILIPTIQELKCGQLGDSMSKLREKRSTSQSGFFFNEMWKIIGQIDDVDPFFNNFCNYGVFLAKNQKYPKMGGWDIGKKTESVLAHLFLLP